MTKYWQHSTWKRSECPIKRPDFRRFYREAADARQASDSKNSRLCLLPPARPEPAERQKTANELQRTSLESRPERGGRTSARTRWKHGGGGGEREETKARRSRFKAGNLTCVPDGAPWWRPADEELIEEKGVKINKNTSEDMKWRSSTSRLYNISTSWQGDPVWAQQPLISPDRIFMWIRILSAPRCFWWLESRSGENLGSLWRIGWWQEGANRTWWSFQICGHLRGSQEKYESGRSERLWKKCRLSVFSFYIFGLWAFLQS